MTHSFHSDEAKAPKANDSWLILPINPDKAHKVNALYMIDKQIIGILLS